VVEAKPVADAAIAQATADALAGVLRTSSGSADITISSFDADLLATIRATCADLPVRTALLGEKSDLAAAVVHRAHRDGHDEVHLPLVAVRRSPQALETARELGLGVSLWTVNGPRDLQWASELGVDAVITDDVRVARAELDRAAVAELAAA
jgi:glycerophosphoryl diester phosphodiesterase